MDATAISSIIWYAIWPVFIIVSYLIISRAVSAYEKKNNTTD